MPPPKIDKLRPGIYVPTVAFFTAPDQDKIDVDATKAHVRRLVQAAVAGVVVQGSSGEAVHLDRQERNAVTRATRCALDGTAVALVAGCGAQSTRETVTLCRDAAESGADFALVLPPSYYHAAGGLTMDLVVRHFRRVADESPLPVLVYNFPAVCSGLDLDSDVLSSLARHPNIVGVKLTCGNTGKLARVVASTAADDGFRVFGGSADFTLQTLSVGGHGVIAGLANVAPAACVEVMRLWQEGKVDDAVRIQAVVATADWVVINGGFVSVKAALETYFRYGGLPRMPCRLLEGDALDAQMAGLVELVELERKLAVYSSSSSLLPQ
ncbi:hypothetical protein L249_1321 [Ophiocordyceps polyrhachis-furcata BCC 54312]|uniref:Dihydrodipicolinate synthase n=1 Tax=Ophiocordyceps polyrhachis-furcata BCC 54312 TaxID=1330021 RepID=A0A367LET8_9HYPO|nr:hypothetical protein L249_1321 [Ophiocordyceps polyrhachis-furcata BCC 54312]